MAKLNACERSTLAHIRLRNIASKKDDVLKETYHNSVIFFQNNYERKMTQNEKRALFLRIKSSKLKF